MKNSGEIRAKKKHGQTLEPRQCQSLESKDILRLINLLNNGKLADESMVKK